MLPELEALLQVQRYDTRLMDAQRKRDEIPRRREALRAALDQAKASHEHAKKELERVRLDRRGQEKEIEVVQSEGAKLERQLLDLKTNKEYQAMLHEIELLKTKRSDRETLVVSSGRSPWSRKPGRRSRGSRRKSGSSSRGKWSLRKKPRPSTRPSTRFVWTGIR